MSLNKRNDDVEDGRLTEPNGLPESGQFTHSVVTC